MVRIEPTAEASFADMRERRRFGMAIAAMMRIIATTISNSMREKPFCRVRIAFISFLSGPGSVSSFVRRPPLCLQIAGADRPAAESTAGSGEGNRGVQAHGRHVGGATPD